MVNKPRRKTVAKKRRKVTEDKYVVSGKIEVQTNPVSQAEAIRTEKKIRSLGGTARRKKV